MTPASPALSLAIPTFNRHASLNRLLASIERALARTDGSKVEIIVADNGSDDDTPSVLRHWQTRLAIRVHRQPTNVGVERNLATLIEISRGSYVWFSGDDDLLAEDVLEWLVPLVERGSSELYIVPAARLDAPADNTAVAFGLTEPVRQPLRRLMDRFGLFGLLGGLGHPVFRRSGLDHFEQFVAMDTLYPHTFSLAASFHDRPAEMLTRTAFLTPVMDVVTYEAYAKRWLAETKNHPMGVVRATLELRRLGAIGDDAPPSFFKRYFNEPLPIHYFVYHELARRIYFEVYRPGQSEWSDLERFFGLLRDDRYASIFAEIRRSFLELEAARQRMADLCSQPPAIGFGPAWPDDAATTKDGTRP